MTLSAVFHHQEASAFEQHRDFVRGAFVFEAKFPRRAQTERGDGGIFAERFFVVAMPSHSFVAIVIEVEQAGIEGAEGEIFDESFQRREFRRPLESLLGGAGVGVGKIRVAIPRDFTGGNQALAENDGLVVFPRNLVEQCLIVLLGICVAEDRVKIIHRAIAWEEVGGGIVAEEVHARVQWWFSKTVII